MNSKLNKRGVVGSLIVMFIATIVIVLILLVFVLGSGMVRKFSNVDAGVRIYDEGETGLGDIFIYIADYQKLIEAKYLIVGGRDLDSALAEVGYEK